MEKPPALRALLPFSGSRWLPLVLALLLALCLLLFILDRLHRAQAEAERLMLELTVRNMNLGLQAAKGHALAHGREHDIPRWVGQNPLAWLGGELKGYQGDCRDGGRSLEPGQWCFDPLRGVLVYALRSTAYVRDQRGAPLARLEWRAQVPPGSAGGAGGLLALRVEPLTAPVWQLDGGLAWLRL